MRRVGGVWYWLPLHRQEQNKKASLGALFCFVSGIGHHTGIKPTLVFDVFLLVFKSVFVFLR